MSFLNKLGMGKKNDEFSLDNDPSFTTGLPPEPGMQSPNNFSTPQNDPFAPPQQNSVSEQSFGTSPQMNTSFASPDPVASTSFNPSNPFSQPPQQSIPTSPGQQLAHEYVAKQNVSVTPSSPLGDDKMELINVKLDAIRSELSSLGHRLTQIEQTLGGKKRGW